RAGDVGVRRAQRLLEGAERAFGEWNRRVISTLHEEPADILAEARRLGHVCHGEHGEHLHRPRTQVPRRRRETYHPDNSRHEPSDPPSSAHHFSPLLETRISASLTMCTRDAAPPHAGRRHRRPQMLPSHTDSFVPMSPEAAVKKTRKAWSLSSVS